MRMFCVDSERIALGLAFRFKVLAFGRYPVAENDDKKVRASLLVKQAEEALDRGDYDAVMDLCTIAIALDPDNTDAHSKRRIARMFIDENEMMRVIRVVYTLVSVFIFVLLLVGAREDLILNLILFAVMIAAAGPVALDPKQRWSESYLGLAAAFIGMTILFPVWIITFVFLFLKNKWQEWF